MPNIISKEQDLVLVPAQIVPVTEVVCTPATPAIPEHCYTTTQPQKIQIEVWVPANPVTGEPAGYVAMDVIVSVEVEVCTPAQPAVPEMCAEVTYDKIIPSMFVPSSEVDWDSNAIGMTRLNGNGEYRFNADPVSSGIASGLTNITTGNHYSKVRWGFLIRNGLVQPLVNGSPIGVPQSFGLSTIFRIVREEGRLRWFINNSLEHDIVAVNGPLYARTIFYAPNDNIQDYCVREYAYGETHSENVTLFGHGESAADDSNVIASETVGTLPSFTGNAYENLAANVGVAEGLMPAIQTSTDTAGNTNNGEDTVNGSQENNDSNVIASETIGTLPSITGQAYELISANGGIAAAELPALEAESEYSGESLSVTWDGQSAGLLPVISQAEFSPSFGTVIDKGTAASNTGAGENTLPAIVGKASEGEYGEGGSDGTQLIASETIGTLPGLTGEAYDNPYNYITGAGVLEFSTTGSNATFDAGLSPSNFELDGGMDGLASTIVFREPYTGFVLDGGLGPLAINTRWGFELSGGLEPISATIEFLGTQFTLDGGMDGLASNILFANEPNFSLDGGMDGLASNITFGFKLDGGMDGLASNMRFVKTHSFVLDGGMLGLASNMEFTSPECVSNGVFNLDGGIENTLTNGLPFFSLDGGLGTLATCMEFVGELGDAGRTFVINTNTGALSEYCDFPFDRIINVQNKRYGVANGKLYRINDTKESCGASPPAYVKTYNDSRIFNNEGQLVINHNLKRNYGAYIVIRAEDDIIIETQADELDGDRYRIPEEYLRLNQQDIIRVDFLRNVKATHWGIAFRNTGQTKLSILKVEQAIQILERKVWS